MIKGALRDFTKFTGKRLCQSLFFNKVAGAACIFIKKGTLAQAFSCEFCEILKNTFFTEHVWVTASSLVLMLRRLLFMCEINFKVKLVLLYEKQFLSALFFRNNSFFRSMKLLTKSGTHEVQWVEQIE